jgi:hypothetical protein
MKAVAIGIGVLAVAGLGWFTWTAYRKASAAHVAADQTATAGPPGAPPGLPVETIGPMLLERRGRGAF